MEDDTKKEDSGVVADKEIKAEPAK